MDDAERLPLLYWSSDEGWLSSYPTCLSFFRVFRTFLGPHRKDIFVAFSISFLLHSSTILLYFHHFKHPNASAYNTFVWVLLSISQFISPSPLSITRRRKRSSLHRRLTYKIIGGNRRVKIKNADIYDILNIENTAYSSAVSSPRNMNYSYN